MPHLRLFAAVLTIVTGAALFAAGARFRLKIREPLDPVIPGYFRKAWPYLTFQGAGTFTTILGVSWLIRLLR